MDEHAVLAQAAASSKRNTYLGLVIVGKGWRKRLRGDCIVVVVGVVVVVVMVAGYR
jgi:hypothetical protein